MAPSQAYQGHPSPSPLAAAAADAAPLLLERLHDTYDRNRQLAYELLAALPTPCAAAPTLASAHALFIRGLAVTRSPRGQESDGGAMLVRLLVARYVRELGCALTPHAEPQIMAPEDAMAACCDGILGQLEGEVALAENNLAAAAGHGPMFGTLTCLRYALAELPVTTLGAAALSTWRSRARRIRAAVARAVAAVRPVLVHATPEGRELPGSGDGGDPAGGDNDDDDDDSGGGDGEDDGDPYMGGDDGRGSVPAPAAESDASRSRAVAADLGPATQVITSCCWRTLREAA